jgi:hypothetical protein
MRVPAITESIVRDVALEFEVVDAADVDEADEVKKALNSS